MNRFLKCILAIYIATSFSSCDDSDSPISEEKTKEDNSYVLIKVGTGTFFSLADSVSTDLEITWTTTDESVAKVNKKGRVTCGNEKGSAIVSASYGDEVKKWKISLKEYNLVWSDEFDGNEVNSEIWKPEIGTGNWGWGNNEKQYYSDRKDNLFVKDGNLHIVALKEQLGGAKYTSARITTKNKFDFTYGKIEARIKLPKGGGTWPAFWLLGYGSWPLCGEIDIIEHVGNKVKMVSNATHTKAKNGQNGLNWHATKDIDGLEDDFHIIGVEWARDYYLDKDAIKFYVDDIVTATVYENTPDDIQQNWPFYDKMYIILNLAIGGNFGGAEPIDDSIFSDPNNPVEMLVDYVRLYQYK